MSASIDMPSSLFLSSWIESVSKHQLCNLERMLKAVVARLLFPHLQLDGPNLLQKQCCCLKVLRGLTAGELQRLAIPLQPPLVLGLRAAGVTNNSSVALLQRSSFSARVFNKSSGDQRFRSKSHDQELGTHQDMHTCLGH